MSLFPTIFSLSVILLPNHGGDVAAANELPTKSKKDKTASHHPSVGPQKPQSKVCKSESKQRASLWQTQAELKTFPLCLSAPRASRSIHITKPQPGKQPFDELHEFVTGLSVIRTKPVSAPLLFFLLFGLC